MKHYVTLADPDPKMVELANANKRLHWRRKAHVTQYWRAFAGLVSCPANLRNARIEKARVVVWITWPDKRRRDIGNWAPLAKAVLDGLVDAGVFPDDNDDHITGPDLRRADPGPLRVVVEISAELEGGLR